MSLSTYLFEGFNLLLDRVSVQGLRNSNRSVDQYYLETSRDNVNFYEIEERGRTRVKHLFITSECCLNIIIMVPPFDTAHTFCASRDIRVS